MIDMRQCFRRRCDPLTAPCCRPRGRPTSTTSAEVPLEQIGGTVARCCDFDRCFRPLRRHLEARVADVRTAFEGRPLPAIKLQYADGTYHVVDGHHRLAVARQRGMVAIDAVVACYC